ncbi:MAG: 2Fe-2S ferredoxin, partial [Alphaproteobacteria bacterium]|nr:2Fe-2S ferredoxin [Alphaproteobacteria bacterium]
DYENRLPPMDEDEQYLLDFLDNRQRNSRLSCQIGITDNLDGMIVTIPEQP